MIASESGLEILFDIPAQHLSGESSKESILFTDSLVYKLFDHSIYCKQGLACIWLTTNGHKKNQCSDLFTHFPHYIIWIRQNAGSQHLSKYRKNLSNISIEKNPSTATSKHYDAYWVQISPIEQPSLAIIQTESNGDSFLKIMGDQADSWAVLVRNHKVRASVGLTCIKKGLPTISCEQTNVKKHFGTTFFIISLFCLSCSNSSGLLMGTLIKNMGLHAHYLSCWRHTPPLSYSTIKLHFLCTKVHKTMLAA